MSGPNYGDTSGRTTTHTTVMSPTSASPSVSYSTPTTSHVDQEQQFQAISKDRVRWGPVLAGLFAALSTLALLGTLGLAIGLSSVDRDDSARAFGIGAGIWGAISGIIAFAVGGYVAASTASTPATGVTRGGTLKDDNGLLQGAMVWMVAIPLSIYFLASGLTHAAGAAGSAAGSAAQTAATAAAPTAAAAAQDRMNREGGANNAANNAADNVAASTQQAQGTINDAANRVRNMANGENVEKAADAGAKGAWGTLISMLVSLGAAGVGGYLGGKSRHVDTRNA